ncbi:ANTH domain-containing protein [Flagelloscypha sp. PMI_526]|nr:ANTH domain-containing protein [Flagelloscypha sp. PMI_526]
MYKNNRGGFEDSDVHYPTRPVDRDRAEQELNVHIKKATSPEETAPKQKHVRQAIVFTWDYRSSTSFWSALRVQPILADEVQTFKALITVHKVLQEGHAVTLKEAQGQTGWLETCARTVASDGMRGYGPLIRTYVQFILAKLRFHRLRPEFNGLFEYEEYITLKGIDDPNEGYETISDLMGLQDQIESFQKMTFATLRGSANNECRISSLVPLVKESWGIYRFITSMLRAMYRRTNDAEVLEPLKERYVSQHHMLRRFYYECSNLKYLTGLINVPKLGHEPPNLLEMGDTPDLPPRKPKSPTPPPAAPSPDARQLQEQADMLRQYEEQQAALQRAKQDEERKRLEREAAERAEFEQKQREQAERERLAQEALAAQQAQFNNQQAAELQRALFELRNQYERDQIFLEQYDRRVKALEAELAMAGSHRNTEIASKDELIKQLQDQVTLWRNKYEALAKLYSQLRTEHLDMLAKFKQHQLKANSAQEAIDKMERMERDLKAKNLELADMLRERDRARFEIDRSKSFHEEEVARLKRELNFAHERADDASRDKNSEVSHVLSKYNRQIAELEDSLRSKQAHLEELLSKLDNAGGELDRLRDEKDQEIAILQDGLDDAILRASAAQDSMNDDEELTKIQMDTLILDNRKKLNMIIDSILAASVQKIDHGLYELQSISESGNPNTTPEYTLSVIESAVNKAGDFATYFNMYLSGDGGGQHVEVITSANDFAQAVVEVLANTKGVTRLASDDDASDKIVHVGKTAGEIALRFFESLKSYNLNLQEPSQRTMSTTRHNSEVRSSLTKLSETIDKLIPRGTKAIKGDIGDMVESEMSNASRAIAAAIARLQELMTRREAGKYGAVNMQVHDSILSAAMAITNAISRLIQAATESQEEIVNKQKGSSTAQQFYKKNNRWTEGLISAAKAVAHATTLLIETADGVLSGTHSFEQLIVASNEVAAATAQLVAASRVKADLMSPTQERLELASRAVAEACRSLVKQVKAMAATQSQEENDPSVFGAMAPLEFKKQEMEQQVKILTLEKDLNAARHRLGVMRRAGYHTDETD